MTTAASTTFLTVNGLTLLFLQDRILGDLHKIDQRHDPPESRTLCREMIHMNGAISLGQAFLLHQWTRKGTSHEMFSLSKSKCVALSLVPRLAVSTVHGWKSLWSGEILGIILTLWTFDNNAVLRMSSGLLLLQAVSFLLLGQDVGEWLFRVPIN